MREEDNKFTDVAKAIFFHLCTDMEEQEDDMVINRGRHRGRGVREMEKIEKW